MFDLMPFDRKEGSLFHYLDNFEKNFWGDRAVNISSFRTDVLDKGDSYVLEAELPGFAKEEINIQIEGRTLMITAEHKEDTEEKRDDGAFIRRERRYGSFSRSFDVGNIDKEKISAAYDNGVLRLTLPKQEAVVPPSRRIEIK